MKRLQTTTPNDSQGPTSIQAGQYGLCIHFHSPQPDTTAEGLGASDSIKVRGSVTFGAGTLRAVPELVAAAVDPSL